MTSINKIMKSEIVKYNKVFADLTLDEGLVTALLSTSESKKRTYIIKRDILKTYINLLDDLLRFNQSHPVLKYIKHGDNFNVTYNYMQEHHDTLNNLAECSICKCLQCTMDCPFNACTGCSCNSYIVECDTSTMNVRLHENFEVRLINNITKEKDIYRVLFTIKNCNTNRMFIVIKPYVEDKKIILYYYPDYNGDKYGEIKDAKVLDSIISLIEVLI